MPYYDLGCHVHDAHCLDEVSAATGPYSLAEKVAGASSKRKVGLHVISTLPWSMNNRQGRGGYKVDEFHMRYKILTLHFFPGPVSIILMHGTQF